MALVNYVDTEGRPICPTCGAAIKPTDNVARPDGCLVHVGCLLEAVQQSEPCEPMP